MNEWNFFVQMVATNLGKCEWLLRGNTKIAESNIAKFKMAEFKMDAIIKLSQNEWVKYFCADGGNQSWQVWVTIERKY